MAGLAAPIAAAKTSTFDVYVRLSCTGPCKVLFNCYAKKSAEGKTDLDKKVERVLLKQLTSPDLTRSTKLVVTIPAETRRIEATVGEREPLIWLYPFDGCKLGILVEDDAIYNNETFVFDETIELR